MKSKKSFQFKATIRREPGMEIKEWTITDERFQELSACEDRDEKVLKLLQYVYNDCSPGNAIDQMILDKLMELYKEELEEEWRKSHDGREV